MAQIEENRPFYKSYSGFAFAFPKWQRALIPTILVLCVTALGLSAHGQTVANWTGKGNDSLWTDAKNWDTRAVPGSNDTANIDLVGSNLVVLDTNLVIGTINLGGQGSNILQLAGVSIQCTGTISIISGAVLEITGNSVVVGGSVQNSGGIMVPADLGAQSLTLMCYFTNSGILDAEANSVLSLPGTNSFTPQFLAGTILSGSGVVQFPAGIGKMNCFGTMSVTGTINVQQPISGSSTWVGPGLFQWLGGSISNVTFAPSLTVQLGTSGQKIVNGNCTNQGTIVWLPGADGFAPNANAAFFNTGLCQFENSCSLGSGTNGFFQNAGTLQVPPNLGTVSLTLQCGFTNYGVVDVESNSTFLVQRPLSVPPTYASFESGSLFEGPGIISFPTNSGGLNNLPIVCNGTITVDGTLELNVSQFGSAVWTGSGLLRWLGSPLFNPTFAPGFQVEISGSDPKAIGGTCTNQGTVRLINGDFSFYGQTGNFYNEGVFQIESNCNFTSGLSNFVNSGTIIVPTGLGALSLTNTCNFTNYATIDVESNSTLTIVTPNQGPTVLSQGNTDFESGTVFAGTGTVQFGPNGALNCDGTITVDGTLILTYVTQTGDATLTGPGLLQLADGGLMNNVTFAPGFNAQIVGSDSKSLDGVCINQGTIRVLCLGGLAAPYGGMFYNSGLLQIETNCYFSLSSFENTGTIKIPPGLGDISLMTLCPFTNFGVIDVETNSALNFPNDAGMFQQPILDFESGTVFTGPGTAELIPGVPLYCNGTMTVNGTVAFNSQQNGNVIWTGPGLLQILGGTMTDVTFAPGFNVQMLNSLLSPISFEGTCTNLGTIRLLGAGSLDAPDGGAFYNSGLFQIESNFYDLYGFTGFQNTGTIRVPPGLGALPLVIDCAFTNSSVIDVETNSELVISNGISNIGHSSQTYLNGTIFTGPGMVSLAQDQVSCSGTMTVNGTLELQQTFIRGGGPSTWTGTGSLLWQNSEIDYFTFATNFHAAVSGFESSFLSGTCTNLGTIYLTNDALEPDAGAFYNYGTIQATGNCGFQGGSTPLPIGSVQNSGTIIIPPGIGSNSFTVNCNFTNYNTFAVGTNSELTVSNGPYGSQTYLGGTTFDGSGTVNFVDAGNGGIACFGSMTDNCALDLQTAMSGASTWTGSGLFSWLGGAISSVNFGPGFQAQISGPGAKFLTGICTNQGTVSWLGGSQLNDSMTSGQFNNSGTLKITTDGTWNNVLINNGGTFCQSAGAFFVPFFRNMSFVQALSGSLNVASNFISSANSIYQVTVNGTTPGTNFNQLNAQLLALSGSLQVVLANGFSPEIGNSFPIMTGRRVGTFSSTALPAPQNNLTWGVQYAPASVVLEVGQPGGALTNMSFANGAFQFSLNGFPSGSYDIQASSNLIDWTTILTNYPFSGSVTVTDTNAAGLANRFYRARIFP